MPDWSKFFENVWQGFCIFAYVFGVVFVVLAMFGVIAFIAVIGWSMLVDAWEEIQRHMLRKKWDKRISEYKKQGGPW